MDKKKINDLKGVARRQAYYATLAKKEGKEANKRMKREKKAGKTEMAKDSKQEVEICDDFAKARRKIANRAKQRIGRKLHGNSDKRK
jgi:hypothetical protein